MSRRLIIVKVLIILIIILIKFTSIVFAIDNECNKLIWGKLTEGSIRKILFSFDYPYEENLAKVREKYNSDPPLESWRINPFLWAIGESGDYYIYDPMKEQVLKFDRNGKYMFLIDAEKDLGESEIEGFYMIRIDNMENIIIAKCFEESGFDSFSAYNAQGKQIKNYQWKKVQELLSTARNEQIKTGRYHLRVQPIVDTDKIKVTNKTCPYPVKIEILDQKDTIIDRIIIPSVEKLNFATSMSSTYDFYVDDDRNIYMSYFIVLKDAPVYDNANADYRRVIYKFSQNGNYLGKIIFADFKGNEKGVLFAPNSGSFYNLELIENNIKFAVSEYHIIATK